PGQVPGRVAGLRGAVAGRTVDGVRLPQGGAGRADRRRAAQVLPAPPVGSAVQLGPGVVVRARRVGAAGTGDRRLADGGAEAGGRATPRAGPLAGRPARLWPTGAAAAPVSVRAPVRGRAHRDVRRAGQPPGESSPVSYARMTSCTRSRAPSLCNSRATCALAVAGLMVSRVAIS